MANEKRVRSIYLFGTLTSGISNTATSVSSSALANLPVVDTTNHAALTISDGTNYEIVYVTAHTASATSATVVRGQEGTTAQAWSNGATWGHSPTLRDINDGKWVMVTKTAADYTLTATTMTAVDTTCDLPLPASAGDVIEFMPSMMCVSNGTTATHYGDACYFDAATIVSGSAVTWFSGSGSTTGNPVWVANGGLSYNSGTGGYAPNQQAVGGSSFLKVTSSDLSGGTVTVRLFYKVAGSTPSFNLYARTVAPLTLAMRNIGPQVS